MSSNHPVAYNSEQFAGTCRVCLKQNGKNMIHIFVARNNSVPLSQMLTCITPLNFMPNDGLPEYVCFKCSIFTLEFYKFQKTCIENESYLRELKTHLLDKELRTNNARDSSTPPPPPDDYMTVNGMVEVNYDSLDQELLPITDGGTSSLEGDNFQLHKEIGSAERVSKTITKLTTDDSLPNKNEICERQRKVAYLCPLCKLVFGSQERLNNHKDKHHPPDIDKDKEKEKEKQQSKMFRKFCSECETYFTGGQGITTHKCIPKPVISQNLIRNRGLHRNKLEKPNAADDNKPHTIQMVYGGEPSTTVNVNVNIQTEKSHDCSLCNMKFRYFDELNSHIKDHIKSVSGRISMLPNDNAGNDSKNSIKNLKELHAILQTLEAKCSIGQKSGPSVCKDSTKTNYPKINFVEVKRSNSTITQPNNDPLPCKFENIEFPKKVSNTNLLTSSHRESSTTSGPDVSKPLPIAGNSTFKNRIIVNENVNNLCTDYQKGVIANAALKETTLGHLTVIKTNEAGSSSNAVKKVVLRRLEKQKSGPAFPINKAGSTKLSETNASNSNNTDYVCTNIKREKEDCPKDAMESKNITQCEICGLFTLNEYKLNIHKNKVHQLNDGTPSNANKSEPQERETKSNWSKFEEITLKREVLNDQVVENTNNCVEFREIKQENDSGNILPSRMMTRAKRKLIENSLQMDNMNKSQKLDNEKVLQGKERQTRRTRQKQENQISTAGVHIKTEKDDGYTEEAIETKAEHTEDRFDLLQRGSKDNRKSSPSTPIEDLQIRTCDLCMKVFFDKTGKLRHIRTVHRVNLTPATGTSKRYFTCVRCLKTFTNIKLLRLHEHFRESNPLKKQPAKQVPPPKTPALGMYSKGNVPCKCLDCDSIFVCRPSLRRHMFRKHKDKCFPLNSSYEYQCICTQPFENEKSLFNHMRKHSVLVTEEKHCCHKCKYSHSNRLEVKRHLKVVHRLTNEDIDLLRWRVCTACKVYFSAKSGLNEHYRIHHGK